MLTTDPDFYGSSGHGASSATLQEPSSDEIGTTPTICPSPESIHTQTDVALFGGAFDPITIAHEMVALATYATTGFKFWFMPCFNHLFGKEMASPQHRLAMCYRVKDDLGDWCEVSNFEIEKKHNGSTYDLLTLLKEEHPEFKFHLVMGTDNYNEVREKWHRGQDLIKENPIIVIGRGNSEITALMGDNLFVDLNFSCSASEVRGFVEKGDYRMAARLVKYRVMNYIEDCRLYGWTPNA